MARETSSRGSWLVRGGWVVDGAPRAPPPPHCAWGFLFPNTWRCACLVQLLLGGRRRFGHEVDSGGKELR